MPKKIALSESDLDMLARVNAQRFSGDELLQLSDAVHELPENLRDWEGRAIVAAKTYPRQPYKAFAADARLVAMVRLVESNVLPIGVLPTAPDGSRAIAESVFEAAASEPLLLRGNEFVFQPESFCTRVLELHDADGNG